MACIIVEPALFVLRHWFWVIQSDQNLSLHATPSKELPVRVCWLQSWLKGMLVAIVAILADMVRHVGLSLYDELKTAVVIVIAMPLVCRCSVLSGVSLVVCP